MKGEVCKIEEMCDVDNENGEIKFVDEVNEVGLYGENGEGIGESDGKLEKMEII